MWKVHQYLPIYNACHMEFHIKNRSLQFLIISIQGFLAQYCSCSYIFLLPLHLLIIIATQPCDCLRSIPIASSFAPTCENFFIAHGLQISFSCSISVLLPLFFNVLSRANSKCKTNHRLNF